MAGFRPAMARRMKPRMYAGRCSASPHLCRRGAEPPPEAAVEIGCLVETASVGDVANPHGGVARRGAATKARAFCRRNSITRSAKLIPLSCINSLT